MKSRAEELLEEMAALQQQLREESSRNRRKAVKWLGWIRHVIYDTYPEHFPNGNITLMREDESLPELLQELEEKYASKKPKDLVARCRTHVSTYSMRREIARLKSSFCRLLDDNMVLYINQLSPLYQLSQKHDELTDANRHLDNHGLPPVDDPYQAETENQIEYIAGRFNRMKEVYDQYRGAFPMEDETAGEGAISSLRKLIKTASKKLLETDK